MSRVGQRKKSRMGNRQPGFESGFWSSLTFPGPQFPPQKTRWHLRFSTVWYFFPLFCFKIRIT